MKSQLFIKRGTKNDYDKIPKKAGELYYLTDEMLLANHSTVYKKIISGGEFRNLIDSDSRSCIDGGEF